MVLVQLPPTSAKQQKKVLANLVQWDRSGWAEYNIDMSVILRSGQNKNLKNPSNRRKFGKKGDTVNICH